MVHLYAITPTRAYQSVRYHFGPTDRVSIAAYCKLSFILSMLFVCFSGGRIYAGLYLYC